MSWIGEGLETDEINVRAAKWNPHFKVTRTQVDHYRKTRKVDLEGIRENGEFDALTTGLSQREKRVERLQKLADLLIKDLFENDLLWTNEVKGIGGADNFERIDYKLFNTAEVAQLRGVLEDIAHEMGDRRPGVDLKVNDITIKVIRKDKE